MYIKGFYIPVQSSTYGLADTRDQGNRGNTGGRFDDGRFRKACKTAQPDQHILMATQHLTKTGSTIVSMGFLILTGYGPRLSENVGFKREPPLLPHE